MGKMISATCAEETSDLPRAKICEPSPGKPRCLSDAVSWRRRPNNFVTTLVGTFHHQEALRQHITVSRPCHKLLGWRPCIGICLQLVLTSQSVACSSTINTVPTGPCPIFSKATVTPTMVPCLLAVCPSATSISLGYHQRYDLDQEYLMTAYMSCILGRQWATAAQEIHLTE